MKIILLRRKLRLSVVCSKYTQRYNARYLSHFWRIIDACHSIHGPGYSNLFDQYSLRQALLGGTKQDCSSPNCSPFSTIAYEAYTSFRRDLALDAIVVFSFFLFIFFFKILQLFFELVAVTAAAIGVWKLFSNSNFVIHRIFSLNGCPEQAFSLNNIDEVGIVSWSSTLIDPRIICAIVWLDKVLYSPNILEMSRCG